MVVRRGSEVIDDILKSEKIKVNRALKKASEVIEVKNPVSKRPLIKPKIPVTTWFVISSDESLGAKVVYSGDKNACMEEVIKLKDTLDGSISTEVGGNKARTSIFIAHGLRIVEY